MHDNRRLEIIIQLDTNVYLLHLLNTVFVQKSGFPSNHNIPTDYLLKIMIIKLTAYQYI